MAPPSDDSAQAAWTRFGPDPEQLHDAAAASRILFACALEILAERTDHKERSIAIALHNRLGQDVTASVSAAAMRRTIMVFDPSKLPVTLTRKQTLVAAFVATHATIREMSEKLGITQKTVGNHITIIGEKLGGGGQEGIRRAMRAAAALSTMSVLMLGAPLDDGLISLQEFFF